MNRNDLFPSKYLKHADLGGADVTLTVNSLKVEEVGPEKEPRPVLNFKDDDKFLILNLTNYNTISEAYGEETDAWTGRKITLYPARTQFGSKIVNCIRIRPPEAPTLDGKKAATAKKIAAAAEAIDDEIPSFE